MKTPMLAAGLAAVLGCASSGVQIERDALPTAQSYPDQKGLFLIQEQTASFRLVDGAPVVDVESHERRLVLDERGQTMGDTYIGHDGGEFRELLSARVECIFPNGERRLHLQKDFDDHPVGSYGRIYSDARLALLDLPDLPAGTVIDVRHVVRNLDPTLFAQRHFFGSDIPVLRSAFHVEFPSDWSIEHKFMKGWTETAGPPEVAVSEGLARWSWVKTDIAAVEEEPKAPGYQDQVEKVAVRLAGWTQDGQSKRTHRSFEDYGRFLAQLQAGTAEPTLEIEQTVERVLAEAGDEPTAQAAALYEWVQENVRYVAIEVGLGGWRPYTAQEVFENRYGDCKDKATLLKSMLEVAGIPSYMASLYSHDGMPRPYVFPNLGINSNHAILAVELGDELVIADPTERTVPFGQLPPRDQEVDLVVIDEQKPRLVKTYASSPDENRRHAVIRLSKDGDKWAGDSEIEVTGAFYSFMKRRLLSAGGEDVGRTIGDYIPASIRYFSSAEWSQTELEGAPALRAKMNLQVKTTDASAGDRMIIRLSDFLQRPVSDLEPGERRTPVVFYFRNDRSAELRLELKDVKPSRLPEDTSLSSAFGRYEMRWSMEDGALVARRRMRMEQRIIPPESYDDFVDFLEAIHRAEGRAIVLEREAS